LLDCASTGEHHEESCVAVATAWRHAVFRQFAEVDAQSSKVTYLAWYMYPITQYYNGATEFGEDLGTPEWTPVTSLVSGWLVGADFMVAEG